MKKFLLASVSVLLVASFVLTGIGLGDVLMGLEWSDIADHFTQEGIVYDLAVEVAEGGSVDIQVGNGAKTEAFKSGVYGAGAKITLTAKPNEGKLFAGWYTADGTFLAVAASYTFTLEEDTYLSAKFVTAPENMQDNYEYFNVLSNCKPDFSFTIVCREPDAINYLKQNLRVVDINFVGTEHEAQMLQSFDVQPTENPDEYLISLSDGSTYIPGTTYRAYLVPVEEEEPETPPTPPSPDEGEGTTPPPPAPPATDDTTPDRNEDLNLTPTTPSTPDGGAGEGDGSGEGEGEDTPDTSEPSTVFVQSGTVTDLVFSIEKEETEVIEVNEGMVFLSHSQVTSRVDDGLVEGEAGDVADYIILPERHNFAPGDIFCVFTGEYVDGEAVLSDDSYYGKVKSVTEQGSSYKVIYTEPSISEIFDELEIYFDKQLALEHEHLGDVVALEREMYLSLLANPTFASYVANTQQAISDRLAGTPYDIVLIDKKNVNTLITKDSYNVRVVDGAVIITMDVNVKTPIKKADGTVIANVDLKLSLSKNISLNQKINFTNNKNQPGAYRDLYGDYSYDFAVTLTEKETIKFAIMVADATGALPESIDDYLLSEINGIKTGKGTVADRVREAFIENSEEWMSGHNEVQVLSVKENQKFKPVKTEISLDYALYFDVFGAADVTYVTEGIYTYGVRGQSNGKAHPYYELLQNTGADGMKVAGSLDLSSRITMDMDYQITGFKSFKVDMHLFQRERMYANGNINTEGGSFAGFSVQNLFFALETNTKHASETTTETMEETVTMNRFGYESTIFAYVNQAALGRGKETVSFIGREVDLLNLDLLKVYRGIHGNKAHTKVVVDKLVANDPNYTVAVALKDGSYLSYENGKLTVAEGAPLYFKEKITLTVTPKYNGWAEYGKNSAVGVMLPTVSLIIEYGNEDAYYASIDTKMQKEFRNLYRSYSAVNASILRDNFSRLIDKLVSVETTDGTELMDVLTGGYIDSLFDTIERCRSTEVPGERVNENKFVVSEADAFEATISFINNLLAQDNVSVSEDEVTDMFHLLCKSEALYNAMMDACHGDKLTSVKNAYETASGGAKANILAAIEKAETEAINDREAEVPKAFRKLFGLPEVN